MKTLFVVATPIGNLSDISKRALDILENVDLIAAEDTRQTLKLLNHYNIKKKLISYHKFNEKAKSSEIIKYLQEGKDIALVSDAGTPCISDPGFTVVKMARENNIEIIGIPGPSAIITALSISGLDTANFSFVGFLPTDNKKLKEELSKIKESRFSTFVIYESPKRLVKLVELLKENFKNSKLFIASDLTKIHERAFFGKIEDVYLKIKDDANIEKGEYVVIMEKEREIVTENKDNPEELSIESLLVDIMVKENCSLKDAVFKLNDKNGKFKKNQIYNASLNLKKIVENIIK